MPPHAQSLVKHLREVAAGSIVIFLGGATFTYCLAMTSSQDFPQPLPLILNFEGVLVPRVALYKSKNLDLGQHIDIKMIA